MLERLGRFAFRRGLWVIATWLVIVVGLVAAAASANGVFRDVFTMPGTDSQAAVDLLDKQFPAANLPTAQVVFHDEKGNLRSGTAQAAVEESVAALAKLPGVKSASNPYSAPPGTLALSPDGTVALSTVSYEGAISDIPEGALAAIEDAVKPALSAGLQVEYGGQVIDILTSKADANDNADLIGLAVALLIMLIVFGTVVSALIPVFVALFGVAIGTAVLHVLAVPFTIGTVAPILGTMIGLGVGIDYSLFILTRYRQNRAAGMDFEDAIGSAAGRAGAAVLFAGITVCLATCGLALAGVPYVATLGFSAAIFVAIMVIAALTLLPALLGLLGRHIDSLRIPYFGKRAEVAAKEGSPFWARWARGVGRYPWPVMIVALLLLLVLAAPVLSMRLGFATDGDDPKSFTQRRAYDLIVRGFGAGANGPLLVAVSLPPPTAQGEKVELVELEKLLAAMKAVPGVAAVNGPLPSPDGRAAIALVVPRAAPNAPETQDLVRRLRESVIPQAVAGTELAGNVHVGGETAELIDLTDRIDNRLLLCIFAVVGGAFLLLLAVFRSVLVPLKAAVMNLLSIAAAYGVVVAVFQHGWGRGLIGLEQTLPIESFVPLMMFAILFGLSMDYEVFLMSRIREEWLRTGDYREAVANGLAGTARVITSAALIMIAVFLSFVTSEEPVVKMLGVGLAVAVAVDATIVRLLLVPAVMELMGKRAWWFPPWLDRIVPHIDLEGAPEPAPASPEPAPAPAYSEG